MPSLLYETGPDKGKAIVLVAGQVYHGGTDSACPIRLTGDRIAPRHFKIGEHRGRFYLIDGGAEGGCRVNGQQKDRAELVPGDRIQVGDQVLRFLEREKQDPLLGRVIGGYEIHELLGRGGMGKVYRARQLSLKREVAIKLLSSKLTRDEHFRQRFILEARAAGAFNHPNVLQVYDVIEEAGLCFYSMEYIPGGTVEDLLKAGTVSIDRALRVVKEAASGLLYAQQKQIVHHDIKPQNLMIDDQGNTKIADMGLAVTAAEGSEAKTAKVMGTPHFMSPERIKRQEQDIRSDLYSLGCTLHMILTGHPPFQGDSVREILKKQLTESPPAIRDERPDVPESLARVLAQLMAKEREDRPAGADRLLEELERVQEKKSRLPVLLGAGAVVLIAAVLYFTLKEKPAVEDPNPSPKELTATQNREGDSQLEEEVEDLKREMEETRASNALLSLPADLAERARVEALRELARTYAGTATATRAEREADALEADLARHWQEAEDLALRVTTLKEAAPAALETLFADQRCGAALAYACDLGVAEHLTEEADVVAFRADLVRQAKETCLRLADLAEETADQQCQALDFTTARQGLEQAQSRFEVPEGCKDEAFLEEIRARFERKLTTLARAEGDHQRRLFDQDLARLLEETEPLRIRDDLLSFRFARVAQTLAQMADRLQTGAYQDYLARLSAGPQHGARLLQALITAVENDKLLDPEILIPGEAKPLKGRIFESLADQPGFKVRVTQGKRTGIFNVPFSRFTRPGELITLLEGRFPMQPGDQLDLAEAALHFACARWAQDLAPLETQALAYDPNQGWTDEARARCRVPLQALAIGTEVKRLVTEAIALEADLQPRGEALLQTLAAEEAAVKAFIQAIGPFMNPVDAQGFAHAENALLAFTSEHADTLVFWYLLDLTGGSTQPGKHLVEFSP